MAKVYEATLAQDLRGDEAALFASGTLLLESETTPLAPADAGGRSAPRTLAWRHRRPLPPGAADVRRGGQPRRGAASPAIGMLELGELAPGAWRLLDAGEIGAVFVGAQGGF